MELKQIPVAQKYDLLADAYDQTPSEYLSCWQDDTYRRSMGIVVGKKILEVGCGTGRYLATLAEDGADVVGLDISERMTAIASSRGLPVLNIDIMDLTLTDEFDLVISSLMFNYIKDKERALGVIKKALKPAGILLITVDNQVADVAVPYNDSAVVAAYHPASESEYTSYLKGAGFVDVRSRILECELEPGANKQVAGFEFFGRGAA